MDDSWEAAWVAALDELELSVDQAELLLAHDHDSDAVSMPPWQPPELTGPPPPEQIERAHRLLERHLRVTRDLTEAMTATRQQLALTARMARNRPQETPVYLDITA